MKHITLLFCLVPLLFLQAQDVASPFAEPPPDESSPLFVSGGAALEESLLLEQRNSPATGYPRVKKNPDSALGQVRGFFTGLAPKFNLIAPSESADTASLVVSPQDPVLKDQRELAVTYTVRNNAKEMTRLEFPSGQRIEILARTQTGSVVERWSDDRSFEKEEGIVVINPRERIEYQEKISTRELRPGQAYTVEAALKTQPDYAISQPVNPR
jgi:hypothetical protein